MLSVDERSQIQALDRTQPGLPMKPRPLRDDGTRRQAQRYDDAFAALNVLEGKVIGHCMARHRHQEFIRFLNKINRETAALRELHLIVDKADVEGIHAASGIVGLAGGDGRQRLQSECSVNGLGTLVNGEPDGVLLSQSEDHCRPAGPILGLG